MPRPSLRGFQVGPAGLGILPSGHRPLDSGSDLVLEAVDSCLALTQGDDRPAGPGEVG